ncbi:inorganic pyrophosphatase [Candidatus Protofrankia datiscae]|nr:inorganic pyrophosphatase [Candidatus Protofrankia datiscae]
MSRQDNAYGPDRFASVASLVDVLDSAEIMSDTFRARLFGNLDELTTTSRLVVDRPAGSRHPRVPQAVYPVDYGYLEGTVAADGAGVDVFRGSAVGAGVVGFFVTANPGKRDVEVKVLIDCTADEIERVRRLLDDLLGIGGLLVRRNLETATGSDGPTAGEKLGAQTWQQRGR